MPKSQFEHDLDEMIADLRKRIEGGLADAKARDYRVPQNTKEEINRLAEQHNRLVQQRVQARSDRVRREPKVC